MTNFKDKLLSFTEESLTEGLENLKEEGKPADAFDKSYRLSYSILEKRFENELKQYNFDETKAYDEFTARKNLDYLRIFIEEFLLIDKEEKDLIFYKQVRNHMRNLLNHYYSEVL